MKAEKSHRAPLSEAFRDLKAIFATEREERLSSMEAALLELDEATDERGRRQAIDTLLRDAHSLKGAAQLVDHHELAEIAHALETRLEAMRSDKRSAKDVDQLLAALDTLRALGAVDVPAADVEATVAALLTPAPPADRRSEQRPFADPPAVAAAEAEGQSRASETRETVRVPTAHLDALLARSADLAELRDATQRQRESVRRLASDLATWRRQLTTLRAGTKAMLSGSPSIDAAQALSRELESLQRNIEQALHESRRAARSSTADWQRLGRVADGIEAELLALRMVPVKVLFGPFARMVRDVARDSGKQVGFEAIGWETPIDRAMVATLKDPVMHLLRNAVRHGIESPEERERAGKPAAGKLALVAGHRAGEVMLEVRDDGAGIDAERVHRRAVSLALIDSAAALNRELALDLIFQPSFSTADAVDATSGRGVGLDVVRTHVRQLGGRLEVESEPGRGTSIRLLLPLTLASQRVAVIRIAGRSYGVPIAAIERIVPSERADRLVLGARQAVRVGDSPVVLAGARHILGLPAATEPDSPSQMAVVVRAAGGRIALLVDGIDEDREIVLRDLGALVRGAPLYAGAALIGDGALLLVLDPRALVDRALAQSGEMASNKSATLRAVRILVVDDSITTRTLEKNILSAAGFEVLVAVDGMDALRVLREEQVNLVLSDIEMPHLDGFGLARRIKEDPRLRDLPVLLVSGVERPGLRETALEAHADAFLSKKGLEQERLLQIIHELVK